VTEFAPAKINLFLHVGDKGADGYHAIASLAVFADIGDTLAATRADELSLRCDGPFGASLSAGPDNLVMRAAVTLQRLALSRRHAVKGAQLTLTKRLPLASGLGGGSADAAAVLRLLPRLWTMQVSDAARDEIALSLGADVPVCLASRASWMEGRGARLSSAPQFPPLHMVLVNPGIEVSTTEVFRHIQHRTGARLPDAPNAFNTVHELADWLKLQRNDLEAPAIRIAPQISECLAALRDAQGCLLARMTGSGATCFGIFPEEILASQTALKLKSTHSTWWTPAVRAIA
jgi:4-diphosphocytidyl-2-C-methyl-D-erythritol kinase